VHLSTPNKDKVWGDDLKIIKRTLLKVKTPATKQEFNIFYINKGANTNDTMVINFINIFNEGPDVSLKGSPTVSPTTAAA
jgi:hypothetical protein